MPSSDLKGEFHRDNHYVPEAYLKQWRNSEGKVCVYRLLVSHPNVPLWKPFSTKGFAYYEYLYTHASGGRVSDEIERWLESEFETPASPVIQKVINNSRLTPHDWQYLIRFLAAQYVRTPARLFEFIQRWNIQLPEVLSLSLSQTIEDAKTARMQGKTLTYGDTLGSEYFPIKATVSPIDDSDFANISLEALVGRGLWLFSVKRLLTTTINVLQTHRWTILSSPPGINWLTSDDPVIQLNFHNENQYDFLGGWASPGTQILLPLSPQHLLYTEIGSKPPPRGTVVTANFADWVQRFTIEHAHRFVISNAQNDKVSVLRPRIVDSEAYNKEAEQWRKWHREQTEAEKRLRDGTQQSTAI